MPDIPAAVERFLLGLETGEWSGFDAVLTDDVVYDASVPGWRYRRLGPEALIRELDEGWTARRSWRIAEIHVGTLPDGVVVELELRGRCPGDEDHDPHEEASRMANVFRLSDGRIAEHRLYCCGEWDEETIRRIDEELKPGLTTTRGGHDEHEGPE